jgi:hypothetical protein
MKATLPLCAILASASASALDAPEVVGVHAVSKHDSQYRNNQNPGVFVRWSGGETAGVYRNSYRTWSAYVGERWSTNPAAPVSLSATLGGVVGYPVAPVLPLVIGSVTVRLTPRASLSLHAMPRSRGNAIDVVHLTAEWRL